MRKDEGPVRRADWSRRRHHWVRRVMIDPKVSDRAKVLAFWLAIEVANPVTGFCRVSHDELAERLGVSVDTVKRGKRELFRRGHLTRYSGSGRGNPSEYAFLGCGS